MLKINNDTLILTLSGAKNPVIFAALCCVCASIIAILCLLFLDMAFIFASFIFLCISVFFLNKWRKIQYINTGDICIGNHFFIYNNQKYNTMGANIVQTPTAIIIDYAAIEPKTKTTCTQTKITGFSNHHHIKLAKKVLDGATISTRIKNIKMQSS